MDQNFRQRTVKLIQTTLSIDRYKLVQQNEVSHNYIRI
jgi:hypothetical protein